MSRYLKIILLGLTFNTMSAQTDEQVLNEIVFDLFGAEQDTIRINELKGKTFFEYDSQSFEEATGFTVPSSIIAKWKHNEKQADFKDHWHETQLNKTDTIFYGNDTIISKKPIFKVMTDSEVDELFEVTQTRQEIYYISKMLFDDSRENALFHFMIIPWPRSFYSWTVLVKKVFGKWMIITRFDQSLS